MKQENIVVPIIIFDDRESLPDFYQIIAKKNEGSQVILIGNKNHNLDIDGIRCIDIHDYPEYAEQIATFDMNYVHRSTNPPNMEKACFHRFIALAIVMRELSLKFAWHLDTDVWYSTGLATVAAELIKNGIDFCGSADSDIYTSVNAGCSFFTIKAANSLSNYIVNSFERNNSANLDLVYENHVSKELSGGICDMTAIAYWLNDTREISTQNSFGKKINGLYINHNLTSLREELNVKDICSIKIYRDGSYVAISSCGGTHRYAALHFGGHSKNYLYILKYSKRIVLPFALNQLQMRIVRRMKRRR